MATTAGQERIENEVTSNVFDAFDRFVDGIAGLNDERDALLRNARESLAVARSTVIDLLTSPNDIYAKISILQDLDSVDDSLRRAQ